MEANDPNRRSGSSGDSTSRIPKPPLTKKNSGSVSASAPPSMVPKYLWIRVALLQKNLAQIIDHLVENSSKYYERDALASDPEYGTILSSLLVGPCALDYSRMKTADHLWTDPPADELVQRQMLTSAHHLTGPSTPPAPRRPGLHYRRPGGGSSLSEDSSGSFGQSFSCTQPPAGTTNGTSSSGGTINGVGGGTAPSGGQTNGGAAPPQQQQHSNSVGDRRQVYSSARDYVESLHQNHKATLLYGKNNVLVQPKDHLEAMPGYLSLHLTPPEALVIKWTPNHLMNGCPSTESVSGHPQDKSAYWEYALNVPVDEVVYLHCHQQGDSGGAIVLVGQDGTQHPHIHFPKGGHLLAFLSCLETGLAPFGHLDPPLWSQRGKGKVFPKLRRRARALVNLNNRKNQQQSDEAAPRDSCPGGGIEMAVNGGDLSDDDESTDYVFRIITSDTSDRLTHAEMMSTLLRTTSTAGGWFPRIPKLSSHSSSTSSSKSLSLGESLSELFPPLTPTPQSAPNLEVIQPLPPKQPQTPQQQKQATEQISKPVKSGKESKEGGKESGTLEKNSDSLELVCVTMKQQIISRAFYGWLAHCRHLRTVRTHLAGLVIPVSAAPVLSTGWRDGVTEAVWAELTKTGRVEGEGEVWGRVYLGGVQHAIRKQVWPYLLGHYTFGSTEQGRAAADIKTRANYESTMSEWLAVEAIIRQRNKEVMAQNMARLMSESQAGGGKDNKAGGPQTPSKPAVTRARTLSNEVFEPDTISFDSADSDNSKLLSKDNTDPSSSPLTHDTTNKEIRIASKDPRAADKLPKDSTSTLTPSETRSLDSNGSPSRPKARGGVACSEVASKLEAVDAEDRREAAGGDDQEQNGTWGRKTASKESSVDEMFSPACVITPDGTAEDLREVTSLATTHDDTQSFTAVEMLECALNTSTTTTTTTCTSSSFTTTTSTTTLVALSKCSVDSGLLSEGSDEPRVSAVSDDPTADGEVEGLTDDATLADGAVRSDPKDQLAVDDLQDGHSIDSRSSCISPSSSHGGGVYSMELLEEFGLNLHRIDNDVQRCDRNYYYFTPDNLEKLRNVMCTYVWEHLSTGYLQGMCDLVAPLLVVFDDEALTYSCFQQLMVRMTANFPHGGQMDQHFANMRSLIQILDSEMFELMQNKGDYSHFYFCYRWFLLDFKRELVYDDVFVAWETIWAAQRVSSSHFFLFLALALVEHYRDIILDNNMDFTDIIKFFNEMAERHDATAVLRTARNLVTQLQTLIENK